MNENQEKIILSAKKKRCQSKPVQVSQVFNYKNRFNYKTLKQVLKQTYSTAKLDQNRKTEEITREMSIIYI